MEMGDWLVLALILGAVLIGSGYLKSHNPQTASVVDTTWTKVSVGAYDWVSGLFSQIKLGNPITNTTGVETNG